MRRVEGAILGRLPFAIGFFVKQLPNKLAKVRMTLFGDLFELPLLFSRHQDDHPFMPAKVHLAPVDDLGF